jgi:hypothetical protein
MFGEGVDGLVSGGVRIAQWINRAESRFLVVIAAQNVNIKQEEVRSEKQTANKKIHASKVRPDPPVTLRSKAHTLHFSISIFRTPCRSFVTILRISGRQLYHIHHVSRHTEFGQPLHGVSTFTVVKMWPSCPRGHLLWIICPWEQSCWKTISVWPQRWLYAW